MRILIINSLSILNGRGGAERSVQIIASELQRKGHQVLLLAFHQRFLFRLERHDGVDVLLCPVPNVYWPFSDTNHSKLLKALFNLADIINPVSVVFVSLVAVHWRADVLWTNMLKGWSTGVWGAAALSRLPCVNTVRELDLLYSGESIKADPENPRSIPFVTPAKRWVSQFVNVATGISRHILGLHTASGCFRGARLKMVVGNPVSSVGTAANRGAGVSGPLRVGWLGRFSPEKGVEVFLSASERARAMGSDMVFIIAGKGEGAIEDRVRAMERAGFVRYAGFVLPDDFLKTVDVLVVTSLWPEPFGRVVIEGFAQGCYVVSTDRGGLPEVNSNPRCGCTYDGSVGALVRELLRLQSPQVRACWEAARCEAAKYAPQVVARQYEIMLEAACAERALSRGGMI